MKTKTIIIFVLAFFFNASMLTAQNIKVKGTVSAEDGAPLSGVAVLVRQSNVGTVTDDKGNYSINVKKGDQLLFTCLGYEDQTIKVDGKTVIDVVMAESSEYLEAATVNVGYGYVKKSDLTGAVTSLIMSDIAEQNKSNLENLLQGRISGVQVVSSDGTPGGGLSVRIRGAASITASAEPLYVIDGFPYVPENPEQTGVMSGMSSSVSPLAMINPSDIESIVILKDASATAIYGSRAANGVVLITTKMGAEGKPRLSYSGSFGMQYVSKKMQMISQDEYLNIIETMGPKAETAQFFDEDVFIREELRDPKAYIDWQDLIFQWGHKTDHQLSLSGGSQGFKYNLSLGVYDENGIVINSDFTRLSGRLNMESKINRWLTVGVRASGSYLNTNGPWSGGGSGQFSGLIYKALRYRPINMNPDSEVFDPGEMIDEFSNNVSNPLVFAYDIDKKKSSNQALMSGYLKINIAKGLDLQVTGGASLSNYNNVNYFASNTDIGRLTDGRADTGAFSSLNWQQENILTYNFSKNRHRLSVMGALSFNNYSSNSLFIDVRKFQSESNRGNDISMATQVEAKTTTYRMYSTMSLLGRINYNYDSRYYLTVSFREDASSRFGANNRWAGFPSVAAAWSLGREKFMSPLKPVLSHLKIRTSYGWTGNQSIPPYSSQPLLKNGYYPWGESLSIGYGSASWGNDNLKWETTNQVGAGVDIELFNGRIGFTYDFYNKKTYDMLLSMKVPTSSGYTSRLSNAGSIRQWGHELTLNATPFNGRFCWEVGFNISFENNRVVSLGDNMSELNAGTNHKVVPGMSLGTFYGWKYDGLYQAEDFDEHGKLIPGVPMVTGFASHQPGDMKFKDLSGPDGQPDGIVNDYDMVPIGQALPLFYGGLMNNFRLGDFELKVFLNYSYGNSVYNRNMENFGIPRTSASIQNYFARVADHWTVDNTDTDVPRLCLTKQDKATNYGHSVDYFLEDASFLRISNITFGYNIPDKFLSRIRVSGLKLYLSVDNAYVFTKYSGYDPEVSMSANPLTPGIDANPYPRARVYKAGLNINF